MEHSGLTAGITLKFGRKIVHLPLKRFSGQLLERLRTFHVLNGKQIDPMRRITSGTFNEPSALWAFKTSRYGWSSRRRRTNLDGESSRSGSGGQKHSWRRR